MSEQIQIKYLPNAAHMEQQSYGSWIDCFTYEDTIVPPKSQKLVNLGFACELPEGYEGHLAARSSTFKRYGLIQTNPVGVII